METPPFIVTKELEGWHLFWAHLELTGTPGPTEFLLEKVAGEVRTSLQLDSLCGYPPVAAMRTLFKSAGTDPGRYRPASEALLRRVLKGPFRLEGRPLLLDTVGPLDAPITGSERVKIETGTRSAWLVAYLPEGVVSFRDAKSALLRLAGEAGGIRVSGISLS